MTAPRRTYLLVAGAWHGAWCWNRVAPLLVAAGHRVLTPELPGTGGDHADPAAVSLESWATFIVGLIRAEPDPVVLVGHSRAGVIISRAADLAPERVERLVYLAAYLLPAQDSVAAAARRDGDSLVPANMVPARSGVTCTLREEAIREAFYGDCDDDTVAFARARLTPEPLKPLVTPLQVEAGRYGAVPRAYIECTRDRTISLAEQRRMRTVWNCDPVVTLQSDHSPFLSHPVELAEALGRL
jgi:pimeloyl-ACP methyl ester carboxylesterase